MEPVVDSRDRLGECPLWDGAALWWVDIHGRAVKRLTGTKLEAFPAPEPVPPGRERKAYRSPASARYFRTPGCSSSGRGTAASVFASVVSRACSSFAASSASLRWMARASR